MAVVPWQPIETPLDGPAAKVFLWEAMTALDVGQALPVGDFGDKTVQMMGTFGGTVTARGSCKPTADPSTSGDWFSLTDPQGNAIAKTAAAGEAILENVYVISPLAGAGVSDVDVYLLVSASR